MGDEERSRLFNDELGGQIVNIYVGSKPEKFCVHRQLLCEQSPYFNRVLSNSREIYAGVFRYELKASIIVFDMLMKWLYRRVITRAGVHFSIPAARDFIKNNIDLHILAMRLEMNVLANAAMDSIGRCYSLIVLYPLKSEISQVFAQTEIESPLRHYMSNAFCFILRKNIPAANVELSCLTMAELWELAKTHDELGQGIFQNLRMGEQESDNPHRTPLCDYHLHDPENPCPLRGMCFDGRLVEHKTDQQKEKREFRRMSQQISELKQPSSRQTETEPGKQGIARESKDEKRIPTGPATPYRSDLSPPRGRSGRSSRVSYPPSRKRAQPNNDFLEDCTPRAKKMCDLAAASR